MIDNDKFFALAEAMLADGETVRFRLKGNSMTPLLINLKDEVIVSPIGTHRLCKYDVVLFRYKGQHLLHRIIKIDGDRLTLQGDGITGSYETCTPHDVIGIMTAFCRPSGKTIHTSSLKWKFMSKSWRRLGWFRRVVLHFYFKYFT